MNLTLFGRIGTTFAGRNWVKRGEIIPPVYPANAILWNTDPLTWNGEYLTWEIPT